jgi:hypothetical protein
MNSWVHLSEPNFRHPTTIKKEDTVMGHKYKEGQGERTGAGDVYISGIFINYYRSKLHNCIDA